MKYELKKGELVKRTKSAALVEALEKLGWQKVAQKPKTEKESK